MRDDTTLAAAGIAGTGPAAEAVAVRENVFRMTAAAEAAVLRPQDPGRWPHDLRAALAARIATLSAAPDLARRYLAGAGDHAALADPASDGTAAGLGPVIAFMDKVACATRDVVEADIATLREAGVVDADIVRLCELNAYLAYQIRLVAGLRLMKAARA